MKVLAENRKAKFDYQVLEKFEAGMVLLGQEVKAIRTGRMGLKGSYVVFKGEELYLIGANIPPYQPKNALPDYDPERSRKLLLNKAEIKHLLGKTKEKGLTLIPLKVYTKYAKIKLEFGIGKGKKRLDKREQIKKRDTDRIIERELKARG
jgi:SsrA-binding protein